MHAEEGKSSKKSQKQALVGWFVHNRAGVIGEKGGFGIDHEGRPADERRKTVSLR
jgi:hypothetical protein